MQRDIENEIRKLYFDFAEREDEMPNTLIISPDNYQTLLTTIKQHSFIIPPSGVIKYMGMDVKEDMNEDLKVCIL